MQNSIGHGAEARLRGQRWPRIRRSSAEGASGRQARPPEPTRDAQSKNSREIRRRLEVGIGKRVVCDGQVEARRGGRYFSDSTTARALAEPARNRRRKKMSTSNLATTISWFHAPRDEKLCANYSNDRLTSRWVHKQAACLCTHFSSNLRLFHSASSKIFLHGLGAMVEISPRRSAYSDHPRMAFTSPGLLLHLATMTERNCQCLQLEGRRSQQLRMRR